jgi:hypothetical protein
VRSRRARRPRGPRRYDLAVALELARLRPWDYSYRGREVKIRAKAIIAYADGERVGPLPLTVRCVPGAVRVLR